MESGGILLTQFVRRSTQILVAPLTRFSCRTLFRVQIFFKLLKKYRHKPTLFLMADVQSALSLQIPRDSFCFLAEGEGCSPLFFAVFNEINEPQGFSSPPISAKLKTFPSRERLRNIFILAEGEGFEPSVTLLPRRFSRPVHSTTLPPLRSFHWSY